MHIVVGALIAFLAALFPSHTAVLHASALHTLPPEAIVLFGGDMLFDRTIRTTSDAKGGDYIFSCIDPVLRSADIVVANLEGPITGHTSVSATSSPGDEFNYTFTFPPSTAALLYAHGIRIVNLGNNHILNFGYAGAASTTEALAEAGVGYFGDPAQRSVAVGTFGGVPLAFINYNEFGGDASTTLSQIAAARAVGDIPVVYTHWGVEYATTSPARLQRLAHEFVDAGAGIVIGSHPHVVEEHEVYKGVHIYYSLGNFIFDQYWNDDVRHGLLVQVVFDPTGVQSVKEIPIELEHDRRTCLLE